MNAFDMVAQCAKHGAMKGPFECFECGEPTFSTTYCSLCATRRELKRAADRARVV